MKYILLLFFSTYIGYIAAQNFYDLETIEKIEITFAESNWDALLDAEKAGDENYILAQSVIINGEVFDSVGVKYKGNSTYRSNQTKNPFHIELDTYKDQDYQGYKDIKLSNVAKDPSFLREVLSYHIINKYMDSPLCNYANVYVNGDLIGLYSNAEAISKTFINGRFNSKANTFVKCNPPEGAGPGGGDYPNLEYLGEDSTRYYNAYELKSDFGWDELIDLCDTLANFSDEVEEILDVDRALWMLALNNAMVNLDSYIGGFTQNYYLYRDDNGRFVPVIWDLNESFGRFTLTGSGVINTTAQKQQMSPFLQENDSNFPLIQNLLSNPTYRRMYSAHYKTILLENFDNGVYAEVGETLQELIDMSVQEDENKFFTYNNFIDNLNSDVGGGGGPGGGTTVGITNLMDGRTDYILALTHFATIEPTITEVDFSTDSPIVNESVTVYATVVDAESVFLGYRSDEYGRFSRLMMADDGVQDDGIADNNVYGVSIPIERVTTQFYVYGENDNIGKFSPERAEHEFHTISASVASSGIEHLVINEFMASNDTTAMDQDGEFDDWIELYNTGSESIDLEGISLSDDLEDLTQWSFPAGTTIEPGEYVIVWADGDTDQLGLHADFKLSSSGESIFLVDTASGIIDEVTYTDQVTDVSFGRFPNGTGDFQSMTPTFNAENTFSNECNNNGGDADNDGVCADVDCDDNDGSVGAQQADGTACDDNDPSTENDAIQADGCTCIGTAIEMSNVVINEFMASNGSTAVDQDGESDDWIELYNNGTGIIDLSGFFITDDESDLSKWQFPMGTTIDAGGYLIIWADGDLDQMGLHADFKLSASGESVILVDADTMVIDAVNYPEQNTDIAYGRFPNGIGDFQYISPTFGAENSNDIDCSNNGGDIDNDGVCADVDCDDNDPEIGGPQAEGTACDDNNAATENDSIQSDGCTCMGTTIMTSDVVINEFMASNDSTVVDQDGEADDWIELYNNGSQSINLEGYFLTDDEDDLAKWQFPTGSTIDADGYLIIWADEDLDQMGLHADFKLSSGGESVLLVSPDTVIIDAISYTDQETDISFGRFPNGTGDFQMMPPTFNAQNSILSFVSDIDYSSHFYLYPNPAYDLVTIDADVELRVISIYDVNGMKISETYPNKMISQVDINHLISGIYIMQALTTNNQVMTTKLMIQK